MPAADIAALALGPLEVRVAGRRVPRWNSLKARAVFQYLLIHRDRPTRRDVLMALQWPDHSHNSARNNLNVALYNLRNTLDGLGQNAQPVLYRDGCYLLNPELTWWIDRNEFLSAIDDAHLASRAGRPRQAVDAYHKAVQLYRGPLFEDDVASEWYLRYGPVGNASRSAGGCLANWPTPTPKPWPRGRPSRSRKPCRPRRRSLRPGVLRPGLSCASTAQRSSTRPERRTW